jgi:hypothetical protein
MASIVMNSNLFMTPLRFFLTGPALGANLSSERASGEFPRHAHHHLVAPCTVNAAFMQRERVILTAASRNQL